MVQFKAKTDWNHQQTAGTSFTIPLTQTTAAGDMLLFTSGGGAISTPAGLGAFTERTTYGGGTEDVSWWEYTAAAGETSISVTLNGSGDNVSGTIVHVGAGLSFVGFSNNGSGTIAQLSNDFQICPNSPVTLSSGHGVLFAIFTAATSTAWSRANSMRTFGPLGKLISVGGNTPGNHEEINWAVGVADVDSTHFYPRTNSAGNYQATTNYSPGAARTYTAQVLYSDTSGITTITLPPTKTAQDNSLPPVFKNNWFVGDNGTDPTIAGYTDDCSYGPGDTVNFKVNSSGATFRVEIFRLCFGGYELFGARNVLGNQAGYITGTPTTQSAPSVDSTLGSTSCSWTTNATWTIPSDAQSGVYYYLLRRTDTGGHIASGHFVVRAASMTGKMVVVIPDQTHQAYNRWGAITDSGTTASGHSLYASGADGATWVFTDRAYAVSFDRPYSVQSDRDVTYLFDSTMSIIAFAEAQGYEMCYVSDIDLHRNDTTFLSGASMILLAGHQEYWTKNTYDSILAAINNYGINLVNLSSNTALWRTRFASGDTNFRTMICYKDSGTQDVGKNASLPGTGFDPTEYTGTWRDTRQVPGAVNNPDIRRENVFGQIFAISGHFSGQAEVDFAHKSKPIWRNSPDIQALTSGVYTSPFVTIGDETDTPDGSTGQPSNMVLLFSQPGVTSGLGANAAGTIYDSSVSVTVAWTLGQTSAGSLMFATGNWRGHNAISRWRTASTDISTGGVDLNWQNAFLCVFYDMGQIPVTLTCMQPGVDTDVTDPAIGAPGHGNSTVGKAYGLLEPIIKVDWKFNQAVNRASHY